jgi:hypothetical protein
MPVFEITPRAALPDTVTYTVVGTDTTYTTTVGVATTIPVINYYDGGYYHTGPSIGLIVGIVFLILGLLVLLLLLSCCCRRRRYRRGHTRRGYTGRRGRGRRRRRYNSTTTSGTYSTYSTDSPSVRPARSVSAAAAHYEETETVRRPEVVHLSSQRRTTAEPGPTVVRESKMERRRSERDGGGLAGLGRLIGVRRYETGY